MSLKKASFVLGGILVVAFLLIIIYSSLSPSESSGDIIISDKTYSFVDEDGDDIRCEFGFKIKYGMNAKNIVNTFNKTYTKDLVLAGVATTDFEFTKEEMDKILSEMKRIKLFEYPSKFQPPYTENPEKNKDVIVTPNQTYYLKIKYNGEIKEIFWDDKNMSDTIVAKSLRKLINDIDMMVQNKKEYKQLPPIKGGYL